jgi:hypothetical protein
LPLAISPFALVFIERPKPLLMKAEPVLTTIGGIHHITSIAADPSGRKNFAHTWPSFRWENSEF